MEARSLGGDDWRILSKCQQEANEERFDEGISDLGEEYE